MSITAQYSPIEAVATGTSNTFSNVPAEWFPYSTIYAKVGTNTAVVTSKNAANGEVTVPGDTIDAGTAVIIYRQTDLTQDKDFVASGRMPAVEVVEQFDKQIIINQEVKHTSSLLPPTTTAQNRQNTTAGFDGNGDPVTRTVAEEIDHLGVTDTLNTAITKSNEAITAAAAASSSQTAASTSAAQASQSATSAATNASTAYNQATYAASQASNAANSATAAAASASAASTSETNAAASEAAITGNLTLTPTLTTVLTDTRVVGDLTTTGDIAVSGQPDGAGSLDLLVDDYNTDAIIRSNGYDLKLVNETSTPYFVARPSDRQIRVYGDLVVDDPTKGIILKSSGGTYYRITVDNQGNLGTSAVTYI